MLRQRLIDVMRPWFDHAGQPWQPLVLTNPSLDLAVAWGAAYFAWLRHTGGKRIGGGIPRSVLRRRRNRHARPRRPRRTAIPVLCVVPRRLEEGEEVDLPKPELELALGQPVLFPLYTSTVRGDDKPGEVLRLPDESLLQLPPLHTVLRGGKRSRGRSACRSRWPPSAPRSARSNCTARRRRGNRWRLEFNVRDVLREPSREEEEEEESSRGDRRLPGGEGAGGRGTDRSGIRRSWERRPSGPPRPSRPRSQGPSPSSSKPRWKSPRSDWPTGLCRRLWEFLEANAAGRGKSPAHLARWYNLTGFVLRPGFGDPVDRYRVEALWKLITTRPAPDHRTEEARRCPRAALTTGSCGGGSRAG